MAHIQAVPRPASPTLSDEIVRVRSVQTDERFRVLVAQTIETYYEGSVALFSEANGIDDTIIINMYSPQANYRTPKEIPVRRRLFNAVVSPRPKTRKLQRTPKITSYVRQFIDNGYSFTRPSAPVQFPQPPQPITVESTAAPVPPTKDVSELVARVKRLEDELLNWLVRLSEIRQELEA